MRTLAFPNKNNHDMKPDGRRDVDADFGIKKYSAIDEKGKNWQKVKSWFGYGKLYIKLALLLKR